MSYMMRRSVIVSELAWLMGKAPPVRRLHFADECCPLCRFLTWGSASPLAAPRFSSKEASWSSASPLWKSPSSSSMAAWDSQALSCKSAQGKAVDKEGRVFVYEQGLLYAWSLTCRWMYPRPPTHVDGLVYVVLDSLIFCSKPPTETLAAVA